MGLIAGPVAQPIVRPVGGGGRRLPRNGLLLNTGTTPETIGAATVLRSALPLNANPTVQQVKGSGFAGTGSATVTGLLTTDTITATGDTPTCTVNGVLTFPGPDCWDVYVHRDGVLWAYWPGINVGATFEIDASGNGHTLYLTDTAITERLDGSGSNYANEAGFTVADGTQYSDDTGAERIPLGYRIPVSVSSGEGCAWQFTPDEMVTGTEVISWWGDSLTLGAAPYLRSFRGGIINRGVGGETSTQIKNRFALSKVYSNIEIIWAGNNNPGDIPQVLSDISEMAASSVSNYLVVGLLINAVHAGGSATKDAVLSINSTLAATYGEKFINILDYLKTQYDPENPQDVIDVGNGITPSSLRSDDVHLNATGYALVAEAVNSKLIELGYCSSVDNSLSTTGNCLNATLAGGAFIIRVQNPPGCPEYDNTVIIQNGGSAALGHINGKIIAITAGSIFDLKLIFTDGTVVTFPCNERIGSTIYGYSQDGDIYLGHLASGVMSILDVRAGSQHVYHHATRYGNGVILTGQLGPEKHYNVSDRDFSSDTGNWSKGAGWAIAGGVATHTGSTGTSIVFEGLSIKGATIRTNFDIVTHGSGITGLSGGTVNGGFYKTSPGSYTKDYQLVGVNLSLYSTSDASVDNVSSAEIYQGDGVVPANPYLPGTDCRGDLI